jgi:hypothetical protein
MQHPLHDIAVLQGKHVVLSVFPSHLIDHNDLRPDGGDLGIISQECQLNFQPRGDIHVICVDTRAKFRLRGFHHHRERCAKARWTVDDDLPRQARGNPGSQFLDTAVRGSVIPCKDLVVATSLCRYRYQCFR